MAFKCRKYVHESGRLLETRYFLTREKADAYVQESTRLLEYDEKPFIREYSIQVEVEEISVV